MNNAKNQRRLAAFIVGAGLLAASSIVTTAQAVMFDFGAIAAANGGQEQGNPAESDGAPLAGLRFVEGSNSVFTDGFAANPLLQVIGTGQWTGGTAYAYLDGPSSGRQAGLGVCKTLTNPGKQCTPSNDDNVTTGETLTLTFNDMVTLVDIMFRGENHFDVGAPAPGELQANETLFINGMASTFGTAVATLAGIGASDVFTFTFGGQMPEQFYVNVIDARRVQVPEPATLGILGAGIALFGFVGRRRKTA